MTNIPIGAAWRPYLRALTDAGIDVASVGAWVAAAELPPARRRLARATLTVVVVALPAIRSGAVATAGQVTPGTGSGLPFVDAGIKLPAREVPDADTSPGRRAALDGAGFTTAVVVSIGGAVAGRQLEQRWLVR